MKRVFFALAFICIASPALADDESEPAPQLPPPASTPTVVELRPPTTIDSVQRQPRTEGAPRYDLVRLNAGARIGYVTSGGYDAFSSNDVLGQFSVDGTYPLLSAGRVVVAAGLGWDVGVRSDNVRDFFKTKLAVHRLYVPIEGRYHFAPWLYGFGKIAPGTTAILASANVPDEVSTTEWAFSADASLGASILMGPHKDFDRRTPRFWLTPEVGYGFTTKTSLALNRGRDDKDILGSDENVNLRALSLSGVFWRATIGTTF
jgi:hypothetical protein